MSHWTTSGGGRLKAKEKKTFARRGKSNASFLGYSVSRSRRRSDGEPRNIQQQHPRFHQRTAVQDLGSTWDCPIARRGIVAAGSKSQKLQHDENSPDNVNVSVPRRKIRDNNVPPLNFALKPQPLVNTHRQRQPPQQQWQNYSQQYPNHNQHHQPPYSRQPYQHEYSVHSSMGPPLHRRPPSSIKRSNVSSRVSRLSTESSINYDSYGYEANGFVHTDSVYENEYDYDSDQALDENYLDFLQEGSREYPPTENIPPQVMHATRQETFHDFSNPSSSYFHESTQPKQPFENNYMRSILPGQRPIGGGPAERDVFNEPIEHGMASYNEVQGAFDGYQQELQYGSYPYEDDIYPMYPPEMSREASSSSEAVYSGWPNDTSDWTPSRNDTRARHAVANSQARRGILPSKGTKRRNNDFSFSFDDDDERYENHHAPGRKRSAIETFQNDSFQRVDEEWDGVVERHAEQELPLVPPAGISAVAKRKESFPREEEDISVDNPGADSEFQEGRSSSETRNESENLKYFIDMKEVDYYGNPIT